MLRGSLDGVGVVWGRTDTCVCMAESLHCSPETITTLLISYTSTQNKVKQIKSWIYRLRIKAWRIMSTLLNLYVTLCSRGSHQFSSVQSLSRVWLFATPWIAARQASLSITNSRSSLRLTSIESVMPSSHLILCRLLLLPPIPPSIRVLSNESTLHMRWPKYWSFSFSISPYSPGDPRTDLL